jgi:D-alanyl-lipoteichoic acid acyltransferase DltB (MBOAT superfamily)
MLFNSWGYLVFLVVAVPLYWSLRPSWRPWVLGSLSLVFYGMWRWDFCFLLIASAMVDYYCAARIHELDDSRSRRRWLLLSLTINLGFLFFFKYTYFVADNVSDIASLFGYATESPRDLGFTIILPLGISFYTFQTISYTIDVYRRIIEPTKQFPVFFTYVTFWPQLIAGPVLRAAEVIPQLTSSVKFRWDYVVSGSLTALAGLFKKVVLADSIAPLVDACFATDPSSMAALDVWVATILFGFQIYFDFSGYSDIAIGSAKMLGIEFPKNFDWPYVATSPRDFWRRWHISLSSWIRDYLYLPLTGQRFQERSLGGIEVASTVGSDQRTLALFATWFIMGLWHGAGWTFAIWGIYHAALVWAYRVSGRWRQLSVSFPWTSRFLMFMLAMLGWIPFRAQSVGQILGMFGKVVDPLAYGLSLRVVAGRAYLVALLLTLGVFGSYWLSSRVDWERMPEAVRVPVLAGAIGIMTMAIIALQRPVSQFIYFQF